MLILLLAAVAAPPPAPQPSKDFIQACYDRAKGQAELDFCSAGEAEAKKHDLEDAEAVACFDKEVVQAGMNDCASEEFERADKALNVAWAKAKDWANGDPQTTKLLLESQRAWLKYRDLECALIADENRGGSIVPLVHGKCLTALTRERTKALTTYVTPMDER